MKLMIQILVVVVALSACASRIEVYRYQYDTTLEQVFLKEGADFSQYDSIIIEGISVWRPNTHVLSEEDAILAKANLAHAQGLFRQTVREALEDRYVITSQPGRNVMRLQAEFIDLRALQPGDPLPPDLNRLRFKTRPGHITMIARLLDSRSGEQLARAADMGKQENFGTYTLIDWNAIASDFEYWARVFRAWMDRIHDPA